MDSTNPLSATSPRRSSSQSGLKNIPSQTSSDPRAHWGRVDPQTEGYPGGTSYWDAEPQVSQQPDPASCPGVGLSEVDSLSRGYLARSHSDAEPQVGPHSEGYFRGISDSNTDSASGRRTTGSGRAGSPLKGNSWDAYPVAELQNTQKELPTQSRRDPSNPAPPPAATNHAQRSRYEAMLLALDDMPASHGIFIGFFTWILLAGFVSFPGTFTSLQDEAAKGKTGVVQTVVFGAIQHFPLYIVSCICTGVGALGMCFFWYRWQSNYLWLVNNIFLPGFTNSLAGVVSTLSSVYGTNNWKFEGSSRSTMIATGGATVVCGMLWALYKFVLLGNVKRAHDKEHGKRQAGKRGGGTRHRSIGEV